MNAFGKRTLTRAALVGGLALTALVAGSPAWAVSNAYHGSDRAQAEAYRMRAYDGESDGNGVYADAYLANGAHVSAWDGNGADGTWGPWHNYSSRIARFRVCEDGVGCSAWIYNPS